MDWIDLMDDDKQPLENGIELPDSLVDRFNKFEVRLRKMETVVTICGALFGVLLTYGLLFISDRFWDTPAALRGLLTLAGGSACGYFSWHWLSHWYLRRRGSRELARMIQRHHKGMGDRLLGVVELAEGGALPENVSPALCRAAIEQVARESEKYDFTQAVAARKSRNYAFACCGVFLLVLIPFLIFPDAGLNALKRWLAPMADVERYTFVSLENLPDKWVVAHGESFVIPVTVSESTRRMPRNGSAKLENQPRIEVPVNNGNAIFEIPGQTREGSLTIKMGDASRKIWVVPAHRTEVRSVTGQVSLPEYLRRPVLSNRVQQASLEVVEGSRLQLMVETTRKLASVTASGEHAPEVEFDGSRFFTRLFDAEDELAFSFAWKDEYGLSGAAPFLFSVNTVEDRPPGIECVGAGRAIAILEDEMVKLTITANDDYGLKEMYINWSSVGNKDKGMADIGGSMTLAEGSPETISLEAEYTFSPIIEHIPEGSMIVLSAFASDYKPGRKPSESSQFRIYVLNRAQHANLIKDQMEALQARIEDLARDEEALLEQNENLSAQSEEELGREESGKKLQDKKLAEIRNKEQLKQLARESEELIKEAIRNRNIPESAIREWAEMSENMKSLAENQMNKAAQALGHAEAQPQKRRAYLKEAVEMEREVVEKLEQMERDVNESIENMVAQNFINRLMQISQAEGTLADGLRILLPSIIGLNVKDLPEEDAEHLDLLTSRQLVARKEAGYLEEDLVGFYNRTREEVYKKISDEMVTLKVLVELEMLANDIAENVGGQAIREATRWQDQFAKWAEYLQEQVGGGGGGGGGGAPDAEEINFELLIGLLRARQTEEGIREQTRILEETRVDNRFYPKDAKKLGARQYDLSNDMGRLERMADHPKLKELINKTGGEMMNAGMRLRKPKTDAETVAIETEIIELLSGAVSECSSCSGNAAAMLMAMMGMGPPGMGAGQGNSGMGNPGGGSASDSPDELAGAASGLADEGRDVDHASGVNPAEFPEEFRDALEGFFNGLEEVN